MAFSIIISKFDYGSIYKCGIVEHGIVKLSVTWVIPIPKCGKAAEAVVGATPWEAFIVHVPTLVMMTVDDG